MSKRLFLSTLIITAVTITFGLNEAEAGFPAPPGLPGLPGLNFNISGFMPAPPGVHVMIGSGRPYYAEGNHPVYMDRNRYYNQGRNHDNGRRNGHHQDRHNRR